MEARTAPIGYAGFAPSHDAFATSGPANAVPPDPSNGRIMHDHSPDGSLQDCEFSDQLKPVHQFLQVVRMRMPEPDLPDGLCHRTLERCRAARHEKPGATAEHAT